MYVNKMKIIFNIPLGTIQVLDPNIFGRWPRIQTLTIAGLGMYTILGELSERRNDNEKREKIERGVGNDKG